MEFNCEDLLFIQIIQILDITVDSALANVFLPNDITDKLGRSIHRQYPSTIPFITNEHLLPLPDRLPIFNDLNVSIH